MLWEGDWRAGLGWGGVTRADLFVENLVCSGALGGQVRGGWELGGRRGGGLVTSVLVVLVRHTERVADGL